MSLIDLPSAKTHLRLEADYPDAQVAPYLSGAERAAAQYLNRALFADADALAAAVAAVPAALSAATLVYTAALDAAAALDNVAERTAAQQYAQDVYDAAFTAARETRRGMVMDDDVRTGILLILGHLFVNREDVASNLLAELPTGSRFFLNPHRIGLGV